MENKIDWLILKCLEITRTYNDLELKFEIALDLLKARKKSEITQKEIVECMGTIQFVVNRLESENAIPSIKTLEKYAQVAAKYV